MHRYSLRRLDQFTDLIRAPERVRPPFDDAGRKLARLVQRDLSSSLFDPDDRSALDDTLMTGRSGVVLSLLLDRYGQAIPNPLTAELPHV